MFCPFPGNDAHTGYRPVRETTLAPNRFFSRKMIKSVNDHIVQSDFIIRRMNAWDLDFAESSTRREGWISENMLEFEGFLEYDQLGCFIAELGSERAGLAVATCYKQSGFFGELIVSPDRRGHQIGARLLHAALDYLKNRGADSVSLDGVPEAVTLYERSGFVKRTRSLRFSGRIANPAEPFGRSMSEDDLPIVLGMDREVFGDDRSFFLSRRFRLFPRLCRVIEIDGRINGFVMAKRVGHLIRVGPFLNKSDDPPVGLLESLPESMEDRLSIGVLESNPKAAEWIRSLGLIEETNPPWRMVYGSGEAPGFSESLWAIGTPAKG
jgi:ribosomal protein S18 acetylase RimI-like enzyme